jgi:adenosylcobinamide amidohydrolase
MELIRFNRQYHLTIKPSHIMLALVIQAVVVGQLAIFSCKWALTEAATANVQNRAMIDQATQKVETINREMMRRYGIVQVER